MRRMQDTSPPAEPGFSLRPAAPADLPAIVGLITELAEFEHLSHLLQVTPEKLRPHLFGPAPLAECWLAEPLPRLEPDGLVEPVEPIAFALAFRNFSTFLGQPGLYLEDLYVQPAWRGHGVGKALLVRLAQLAVERDCGRFEWSVLDWNQRAIGFYEGLGAKVLPDWRICRVSGEALQRLGGGAGR